MNTDWLHAFIVFSQAPSIEAAARQLKTTQPTLTRQLKALEGELRTSLFSMQGRKKVLTQAGQDLAAELLPRFEGLDLSVQRALLRQKEPDKVNIRIGGRREILARYASKIKFSGHLIFEFLKHDEIVERLLARKIDIGISHELPDSLHIIAQPIFKDHFQLCYPSSWKLKETSAKKLIEDLSSERPFLAYDETLSGARPILHKMGIASASLKISRSCPDWTMILSLIADGSGWSLIPANQAFANKQIEIVELPKDLQNSSQFYLIFLKELATFPWFQEIRKTSW